MPCIFAPVHLDHHRPPGRVLQFAHVRRRSTGESEQCPQREGFDSPSSSDRVREKKEAEQKSHGRRHSAKQKRLRRGPERERLRRRPAAEEARRETRADRLLRPQEAKREADEAAQAKAAEAEQRAAPAGEAQRKECGNLQSQGRTRADERPNDRLLRPRRPSVQAAEERAGQSGRGSA